MLTRLSTIKSRLAISVTDYDALLTSAIKAISARFDKETNRTLSRSTDITDEFSAHDTEVPTSCYPVETVTKFELKSNETDGWSEQTGIEYLLRRQCVISLRLPLGTSRQLARVTYTGGYLLPGDDPPDPPVAVCQDLPDDLEQAAVEQVSCWFRNRDKTGLLRSWPHDGTYDSYLQSDLLLEVRAVLKKYERWTI